MRFTKFIGGIAVATASLAAMTGVANAQTQTSFATVASENGLRPFTYVTTGLDGGGFSINTTVAQANLSAKQTLPSSLNSQFVNFTTTGLRNIGNVTIDASGSGTQQLTGGSFSFSSAGGTVLLSGSFGAAELSGPVGGTTGSVVTKLNTVLYDSTPFFTASGLANPGSLSFNFTSITSATDGLVLVPFGGGQRFDSFTASGSGTFSATNVVPEPSEWLAMGMAATSVGGLMFRAKLKLRAKRQQVAA